jgi:hypothetical protein
MKRRSFFGALVGFCLAPFAVKKKKEESFEDFAAKTLDTIAENCGVDKRYKLIDPVVESVPGAEWDFTSSKCLCGTTPHCDSVATYNNEHPTIFKI